MARGLLSLGTMTGLLIAITGVAALTVFLVLVIQQHNDLASVSHQMDARDASISLEISRNERGHVVGKTGTVVGSAATGVKKPLPIETTAQCNGPLAPNCTRWDMWSKCFIPLADLHPKDGYLTRDEVAAFMDNHLRFYERWAAPSADKISMDCDKKKGGNGRVNWAIFRDSTSPGCLGTVRDICLAKGACERELEKLKMPPVVVMPSAAAAAHHSKKRV